MPTLQKFKLFATQCAAIHIPTQSPTTSPLFLRRRHHRRRKTLRMFLTRRNQISDPEPDFRHQPTSTITSKRSKLKELFISASSSPTNFTNRRDDVDDRERVKSLGIEPKQQSGQGIVPGSVRPMTQLFGFRNRMLLRKPWRPVLSTIEEIKE